MDTFGNWGREYRVEFDIEVNGPIVNPNSAGWVNVFRMSTLQAGQSLSGSFPRKVEKK